MPDKILIKALITGGLIAVLTLATNLISNLVQERQERQKEATQDASRQWATGQTFTSPYLVIPYKTGGTPVIILPQDLTLNSNIQTQERSRSLFKMVLYRSQLQLNGTFKPVLPNDLSLASLDLTEAKLCIGLSDFKGIEEKLSITAASHTYDLAPGLPNSKIDNTGLSATIPLTTDEFSKGFDFSMKANIKGSGQLHFVPLAANSQFSMSSAWPSPSFDGNTLPITRTVNDSGFTASWSFNQANLPFPTVITKEEINKLENEFGVTVVQPADQYAQTSRTIKYALLVIGLTMALFFVTEIMQKRPVHPVQYVLIGLALVIFYTLLLSISEYVAFNIAYFLAALATVLLITLYAKGHFNSWKTAGIFSIALTMLYGFIFIIIRLEETALLVGSIGLFVILAIAMYASRKINWYHITPEKTPLTPLQPNTPAPSFNPDAPYSTE
ncbi:inner membrane protein [Filimonas lacunae]|uniref:Inner membrane protein n=1 Tax=Filimonas lacunae TaxID=477680 RepID=A0A173MN22_9BACT|nr:cell envelope integrity protein CreD [Filimonas lacunae]BAV08886.1 inner membrane protein CreD-like protein [Filimonas lacunae]SIS63364.1 inner membrane protein [Filimonas lacunae]